MRRPKPPVSLWISAERKRHGWKVADLASRLQAAGYEAAETTVRTWEAGRSPHPDTISGLSRLFGSQAPVEPDANGTDLALVLREIRDELRLSRLSADKNADVLAELLGVVLAGRLPQPGTASADAAPAAKGRR